MKKKIIIILLVLGIVTLMFVFGYNYLNNKTEIDNRLNTLETPVKPEVGNLLENIDDTSFEDTTINLPKDDNENNSQISNNISEEKENLPKVDTEKSSAKKNLSEVDKSKSTEVKSNNKQDSTQITEVMDSKPVEVKENDSNKDNTSVANPKTAEETIDLTTVVDPRNPNYSFHKGKIDTKTEAQCNALRKEISFLDTVDINYSNCDEVYSKANTIMGYYLRIHCNSGNCERYKDQIDMSLYQ